MIDITITDYERLKKLRLNISYTQGEVDFMLTLMHKFVDPNARVCLSCKASIQDFKQKLFGWMLSNQEQIEQQLYPQEPEVDSFAKAQEEVKKYTKDEGPETK